MDPAEFRLAFPEFVDEQTYPNSLVAFWYGVGESLLNEERWGDLLEYGLYLFTAHQVSLARTDIRTAELGRVPGQTPGVISNKSVGDVSVGYDTQGVSLENAGNFFSHFPS